jgi:hypothetical protein
LFEFSRNTEIVGLFKAFLTEKVSIGQLRVMLKLTELTAKPCDITHILQQIGLLGQLLKPFIRGSIMSVRPSQCVSEFDRTDYSYVGKV